MSEQYKKFFCGGIEYSINEEEKTASVTKCKSITIEIIIPHSVKFEMKEYIVTSITSYAFFRSKIRSVSFEQNSELRTIEKDAFSTSALASIQIPAGAVDLEDGWCSGTRNLIHVEVDPGNARYSSVGDKLIIGKSDIGQEDYETLVFCARDATEVNIPPTIKIILPYAFSQSGLASIQIPSHVTQICENAFSYCKQLSRVSFGSNSELRTIEKEAFFGSKLASIQIPAGAVELKDGWCSATYCLSHVEVDPGNARYSSVGGKLIIGKPDIGQEDYETLVFCARDATEVNIPPTIKIIGSYAFSGTKLASIQIPSHITKICENAFSCCRRLIRVEFEQNSELQTIGKKAFFGSELASILIPSHVTQICENVFYNCSKLSRVEFEPNSELQTIEKYAFSLSKLASIIVPSKFTHICDGAFSFCSQLQIAEIDENSTYDPNNMKIIPSRKIIMFPARKKIL